MPKREVDKRKTAKALRKLRKVVERTQTSEAPKLTAWEQEFVSGVSERLETYGSAFRDLSKGRAEEALSMRQAEVARVIDKKSRPKTEKLAGAGKTTRPAGGAPDEKKTKAGGGLRRTPFRNKAAAGKGPRVRDINDDPDHVAAAGSGKPSGDAAPQNTKPALIHTTGQAPNPRPARQNKTSAKTPSPASAGQKPVSSRPSLRLIPGGKAGD